MQTHNQTRPGVQSSKTRFMAREVVYTGAGHGDSGGRGRYTVAGGRQDGGRSVPRELRGVSCDGG